jgi:hypothetical protein
MVDALCHRLGRRGNIAESLTDVLFQLSSVHPKDPVDATLKEWEVLFGDDHGAITDVNLTERSHESKGDLRGQTE